MLAAGEAVVDPTRNCIDQREARAGMQVLQTRVSPVHLVALFVRVQGEAYTHSAVKMIETALEELKSELDDLFKMLK